jgi:hypothetical protein
VCTLLRPKVDKVLSDHRRAWIKESCASGHRSSPSMNWKGQVLMTHRSLLYQHNEYVLHV